MRSGYLSSKLEVRNTPEKGGNAVFATQAIAKDELLATWGGRIASREEVLRLSREEQGHTVQVHEELYLAPITMDEPADFINHSCDPNAGIDGQICVVAMRSITAGEEITFDYAMADSSPIDEFECSCNSPHCRKKVTGSDWLIQELWQRYDGYFSSYLQQKINRLRQK